MHETEQQLQKRIHELEELISNKQKALQSAPEGSLHAYQRKDQVQCYWYKSKDQNNTYIRDDGLIRKLSQKEYDKKILKAGATELNFLKKVISRYPDEIPESVFMSFNKVKQQFVTPIQLSDQEFAEKWQSVQYTAKGFSEGTPEYYTEKGERVRSKSEILIANRLYKRGIPYLYECPFRIKGVGVLYPDFRILNVRLRKEYIHEHFGMMDDRDYADGAVKKINTYTDHGIFPGDRLIITSETRTQPLSMKTLDHVIDHYYV